MVASLEIMQFLKGHGSFLYSQLYLMFGDELALSGYSVYILLLHWSSPDQFVTQETVDMPVGHDSVASGVLLLDYNKRTIVVVYG